MGHAVPLNLGYFQDTCKMSSLRLSSVNAEHVFRLQRSPVVPQCLATSSAWKKGNAAIRAHDSQSLSVFLEMIEKPAKHGRRAITLETNAGQRMLECSAFELVPVGTKLRSS